MRYEIAETGESALISGSSFPSAGDGFPSQFPFLMRGGTAEISFDDTINDTESVGTDTTVSTTRELLLSTQQIFPFSWSCA
jgi:hypothetical protein